MIRSAASKVMWVGRATVFLVGLAVILALVFGVASRAMGANGGNFILGKQNVATAISKLAGKVTGPSLLINNASEDPKATALQLNVKPGKPPMKVNSDKKVAKLNADKLDNLDQSAFLRSTGKAADSDKLDGKDSADFYAAGSKVADSDKLDGKSADNFVPGDLPSGATIRGAFLLQDHATSGNQTFYDAISFGYRLPPSSSVHYIKSGDPVPAGCSGSGVNPEASPGHLCIFETVNGNTTLLRGAYLLGQGRTGAAVYMTSSAAGSTIITGSWAVTAQ